MDAPTVIAKRIARELRDGMLVNLGIGIPTLVANFVPKEIHVFFQSENGLIGTGPVPEPGMALRWLTDAGGKPGDGVAGRFRLRQCDVVRPDPRRAPGPHGAGRIAGRPVGPPGQLDDSGQANSRHGRRHGPRHRREAGHRRHAACGERQVQAGAAVLAPPHIEATGSTSS